MVPLAVFKPRIVAERFHQSLHIPGLEKAKERRGGKGDVIVAEQSRSVLCYQPLLCSMEAGARAWSGEGLAQVLLAGGCVGRSPRHGSHHLCSPGPRALPRSGPTLSKCSGVWSGVGALTLPFRGGRDPPCPFVHHVLLWKPHGRGNSAFSHVGLQGPLLLEGALQFASCACNCFCYYS